MSNSSNRNLVAKSIEGIAAFRNYVLNPNARENVLGWATYADAAGPQPVNGTGGSPSITLTRNTSSPLRLDADFLITKDAADRQGEGVSYNFTIDNADKNQQMAVVFDYSGSANFVSGSNSDIQVFVYDVTNSVLIPVDRNALLIGTSTYVTTFQATQSTSYRLIFHIATTNASAWTFQFTGVNVSTAKSIIGTNSVGPAISDFEDTNLTFSSGFGTPTQVNIQSRRVGDSLEVYGTIEIGTVGADTCSIQLPPGLIINSSKISSNTNAQILGNWFGRSNSGGGVFAYASSGVLFYDGTTNDKVFVTYLQGVTPYEFEKTATNAFLGNNFGFTFEFKVPIAGWSADVAVASSGIIRMSEVLANGTRVTSAPTQLGEYRSRSKTVGSSNTFTDETPTTLPSAADGIRIYAVDFVSAQTAGQISLWDIFVGKFKSVRVLFYSSSGRTGELYTDFFQQDATYASGTLVNYDEGSGIVSLNAGTNFTNTVARALGANNAGGGVTDGYFEIYVADNDYQIQMVTAKNQTRLSGSSGFGSTGTKIRVMTTVIEDNNDGSYTYVSDPVNGDYFQINTAGIYYGNRKDGSTGVFGWSLNASSLTTGLGGLPNEEQLMSSEIDTTNYPNCSFQLRLSPGDIVRMHGDGSQGASSDSDIKAIFMKVSN